MPSYCSYCGYGWLKHNCLLCGASIRTCGCDCARDVCEEHSCVDCGEPFLELNDDGLCADCDPLSEIAVGVEIECKFLEDVVFWGGLTIKEGQKLGGPVTCWQPGKNFLKVGAIPNGSGLAIPIDKVEIKLQS